MSQILTWVLSLLAALATLVVLALHMTFVEVNYILLVALALYHGFYGLHTILTEFWTSRRAGRLIASMCIAVGGGLFALAVATTAVG